jgi:hypothetical protein
MSMQTAPLSPVTCLLDKIFYFFISTFYTECSTSIFLIQFTVFSLTSDLGEVGWGDVDWIGLAKDRNRWRARVNSVMNIRVP